MLDVLKLVHPPKNAIACPCVSTNSKLDATPSRDWLLGKLGKLV